MEVWKHLHGWSQWIMVSFPRRFITSHHAKKRLLAQLVLLGLYSLYTWPRVTVHGHNLKKLSHIKSTTPNTILQHHNKSVWVLSVRLSVCPSVRLSRSGIVSERLNISSHFLHHRGGATVLKVGGTILRAERAQNFFTPPPHFLASGGTKYCLDS